MDAMAASRPNAVQNDVLSETVKGVHGVDVDGIEHVPATTQGDHALFHDFHDIRRFLAHGVSISFATPDEIGRLEDAIPQLAGTGDNQGEVDAQVEGGDEAKIALNSKYLADVLDVLQESEVALETTSPSSPGVLKPVGNDRYIHVVMPMFVQW